MILLKDVDRVSSYMQDYVLFYVEDDLKNYVLDHGFDKYSIIYHDTISISNVVIYVAGYNT